MSQRKLCCQSADAIWSTRARQEEGPAEALQLLSQALEDCSLGSGAPWQAGVLGRKWHQRLVSLTRCFEVRSLHMISVNPAYLHGFLISWYPVFCFHFKSFSLLIDPLFFYLLWLISGFCSSGYCPLTLFREQVSIEQNRQQVLECPAGHEHYYWSLFVFLLNDFWIKFVIELIS